MLLAAVVLSWTPAGAREARFGGEVRPRHELHHGSAGETERFTSMRTRIRIEADGATGVRALVQLQDVRKWGEETGTLTDYRADALSGI